MSTRHGRPPGQPPPASPLPESGVLRRYLGLDADAGMASADPAGRPVHAYDGDSAYLGSFPAPSSAHEWAHQRAAEPRTVLPVEVDDRAAGWTHQVWPDHCQLLLWPPPIPVQVDPCRTPLTLVLTGDPA